MSFRSHAAVAALLLGLAATPVAAQTAPRTAPSQPAAAEPDAEAALEARGEAFGERMKAMSEEMQAALAAKGGDAAAARADLDAVQARYQPEADAFAEDLAAFIRGQAAQVPDEAQRAQVLATADLVKPQIAAIPAQVRAEIENPSEDDDEDAAPAPQ